MISDHYYCNDQSLFLNKKTGMRITQPIRPGVAQEKCGEKKVIWLT